MGELYVAAMCTCNVERNSKSQTCAGMVQVSGCVEAIERAKYLFEFGFRYAFAIVINVEVGSPLVA